MDDGEHRSDAARRGNVRLLTAARELELRQDVRLVFVCECRDPDCVEYVRLTLTEHDGSRNSGGVILYPGHRPAAEQPMAAERDALFSTIDVEQEPH